MEYQKPQFYFLLILLAITGAFSFFIFKPFLYALTLAAVCAVVFEPLYLKIKSAVLTTLIVLAVIFVPLLMLGVQVFKEATDAYSFLVAGGGTDAILETVKAFAESARAVIPVPQGVSLDLTSYAAEWLKGIAQHLDEIFAGFIKVLISTLVFIGAVYCFLKNGDAIKKIMVSWSPLHDADDAAIFEKMGRAVRAVVIGKLLVALTQGALAGLGFWVAGIPNAALWGSVTAVAALIPGIGTALVMAPAIIFLVTNDQTFAAVGLAVWGVGVVGFIDNIVGPKLIGRGIPAHPFIILLSVVGGIGFFGPVGFILGPLMVTLLFILLDLHLRARGS